MTSLPARTWARALTLADRTPDTRNRLADFLRAAAILVVVFGHWLAGVPSLENGELSFSHVLDLDSRTHYFTWLIQVMPVFFLVGGYSNGKSLTAARRDGMRRREWLATRYKRLMTPIVPFLLVWSGLVVVLGYFVDLELLHLGSQAAAVPLWFLSVYLIAVAVSPWTFKLWERVRWWSVAVPFVLAVALDAGRFQGLEGMAWGNYVFVWLGIHQLGYVWAERDRELSRGWAVLFSAVGLGGLAALTIAGPYPVAVVGVPSDEFSNTTPPTIVLIALAVMQIGVISLLSGPLRRWLSGRKAWASVVLLNGMIMSIFVWHITAAGIGIGVVYLAAKEALGPAPLGTVWWLTRPVWFALLLIPLMMLVAVFGRYESRTTQGVSRPRPLALGVGVVLSGAALASSALFGTARVDEFPLRWWVPLLLIVGTFLAGMFTLKPVKQ